MDRGQVTETDFEASTWASSKFKLQRNFSAVVMAVVSNFHYGYALVCFLTELRERDSDF